jgi:hypothetical protein
MAAHGAKQPPLKAAYDPKGKFRGYWPRRIDDQRGNRRQGPSRRMPAVWPAVWIIGPMSRRTRCQGRRRPFRRRPCRGPACQSSNWNRYIDPHLASAWNNPSPTHCETSARLAILLGKEAGRRSRRGIASARRASTVAVRRAVDGCSRRRTARAMEIRDHVVLLIRARGTLKRWGLISATWWQEGNLRFAFCTPFSRRSSVPLSPVSEWVAFLERERLWGPDDPLFPASRVALGPDRQFQVVGLDRKGWSNSAPIRKIFRDAFTAAGLPYSNPHAFRKTLAQLGQRICQTPEELKAWSQNIGHDDVLTTLTSYGAVGLDRQAEIIRNSWKLPCQRPDDLQALFEVVDRLKEGAPFHVVHEITDSPEPTSRRTSAPPPSP